MGLGVEDTPSVMARIQSRDEDCCEVGLRRQLPVQDLQN